MGSMALSFLCTAAQRLSMDDTNIRNRWSLALRVAATTLLASLGYTGPCAPYSWDLMIPFASP